MSNSPWQAQGVFAQIQSDLKGYPALAQGSAILLDESPDEKAGTNTVGASLEQSISEFAALRKISRSMVAYRSYLQRTISEAAWRSATQTFHRQWLAQRDRRRESAREATGGPNYYVVRRHRLGSALLSTTARLLSSGALTTVKAGQVLGVKPNFVQALVGGVSSSTRRTS